MLLEYSTTSMKKETNVKVLAPRHTGIIVIDFDLMCQFYIGLGLKLRREDIEEGQFIETLLDHPGIKLRTAKLILENSDIPHGYQFNLELMQILEPQPSEVTYREKIFDLKTAAGPGVLDLAFTVDNIAEVSEYINQQGGKLISKPLLAKSGFPAFHCYATDPEGNVLHIAQNIEI